VTGGRRPDHRVKNRPDLMGVLPSATSFIDPNGVSRRHAEIDGGKAFLTGRPPSRNKPSVKQHRGRPGQHHRLQPGLTGITSATSSSCSTPSPEGGRPRDRSFFFHEQYQGRPRGRGTRRNEPAHLEASPPEPWPPRPARGKAQGDLEIAREPVERASRSTKYAPRSSTRVELFPQAERAVPVLIDRPRSGWSEAIKYRPGRRTAVRRRRPRRRIR